MWSDSASSAPNERSSVIGFAYVGTVCTNYMYSIQEDAGGFGSVVVKINKKI